MMPVEVDQGRWGPRFRTDKQGVSFDTYDNGMAFCEGGTDSYTRVFITLTAGQVLDEPGVWDASVVTECWDE